MGQGGGKRKMFIHIWPIVELEYKYSFIALICICLNLIQYGSSHFTVYQTAWALTAMLTKNVLPLVKHMLTLFQFYIKGCITHKMVGKKGNFFNLKFCRKVMGRPPYLMRFLCHFETNVIISRIYVFNYFYELIMFI